MSCSTPIAVLTPPGRGAVATVRIVGAGAGRIVGQSFHAADGKARSDFPLGRVLYGQWGSPEGEEVVVCGRPLSCCPPRPALARCNEPAATPEPAARAIDIHCHGGSAAVAAIVQSLVERGAEVIAVAALPGVGIDHLQTLSGGPVAPALAREARRALASASTLRSASILLDQWAGALAGEVSQIDLLLSSNHANDAVRRLETVLQRSDVGLHLTTPWRVVLAGRPNVGKSSLINALLGYERSIVFNQPGTTREVVTAAAALEGWPVELTDTAGLRALDEANSADALEAAGMAKAREQFAAADLLVLVFDATQPWRPEEEGLVQRWPSAVRVLSKCDVTGSPAGQRFVAEAGSGTASPFLRTSAITGEGIESLGRHIAARLVPEVPPAGAPVPFTTRQVDLLTGAVAAAKSGQVAEARTLLVRLLSE